MIVEIREDFSVRLFRDWGIPPGSAVAAGAAASVPYATAQLAEVATKAAAAARASTAPGAALRAAQANPPAAVGLATASAAGLMGIVALAEAVSSMEALSSQDAHLEAAFRPITVDYDPGRRLAERLRHRLEAGKFLVTVLSSEIKDRKTLKQHNVDAVLQVTLKEWGLRPCMVHGVGGPAQMGAKAYGTLVALTSGTTLWEREELYRDGECHPSEVLRSHEALFDGLLTRMIDNLAAKLANEILFP